MTLLVISRIYFIMSRQNKYLLFTFKILLFLCISIFVAHATPAQEPSAVSSGSLSSWISTHQILLAAIFTVTAALLSAAIAYWNLLYTVNKEAREKKDKIKSFCIIASADIDHFINELRNGLEFLNVSAAEEDPRPWAGNVREAAEIKGPIILDTAWEKIAFLPPEMLLMMRKIHLDYQRFHRLASETLRNIENLRGQQRALPFAPQARVDEYELFDDMSQLRQFIRELLTQAERVKSKLDEHAGLLE